MHVCTYVCIQIIIRFRMIKARIRWCTCRVENILTLCKLLSLWFCFLLHSILFLISQTSYRTYKIISSYKLARPVMGTIFLVFVISCNLIPKNTQKAEWERGGGGGARTPLHPPPPEINPADQITLNTLDQITLNTLDTRETIILSAVDLYMY